jgi:predicted transcriptional regulator
MAPSLTGAQTRMARALQAILSSENPMTVQVAITLTDEQKAQLDLIAETRGGAVAEVVQEALQSYLHYDAKFRAAVAEGLAAYEAGDVHDWADVKAELQARFGKSPD